jgi:hypothetical protein
VTDTRPQATERRSDQENGDTATLAPGSSWTPLDQARFRSLVEETVLPPTTSVELLGGADKDWQNRLDQHTPHVGEAFIANTRLARRGPYTGRPDPAGPAELWRMLTELSYAPNEEDLEPGAIEAVMVGHEHLEPRLARLLGMVTDPEGPGQAFFGIDAFVVLDGNVYRQPLGRPFLWRERVLDDAAVARFDQAVLERPDGLDPLAWIVLVGAPWRHMMFYGPRGLRRTFVDAGRAAMLIGSGAASIGLASWFGTDVIDRELEDLLLLDGVERFVAGVCAIAEPEEADDG